MEKHHENFKRAGSLRINRVPHVYMCSITFASGVHGKKKGEKTKKIIKKKRKEAEHRLPMRVNVRVLIMPRNMRVTNVSLPFINLPF